MDSPTDSWIGAGLVSVGLAAVFLLASDPRTPPEPYEVVCYASGVEVLRQDTLGRPIQRKNGRVEWVSSGRKTESTVPCIWRPLRGATKND